jgi:hypothetical protein
VICAPGLPARLPRHPAPGEHELITHSVDLMRRADGSMCVLGDRAQSPSGAGYALENRTVSSRAAEPVPRERCTAWPASSTRCAAS